MAIKGADEIQEESNSQKIANFLVNTPPNNLVFISDMAISRHPTYGRIDVIRTPQIQLHCDHVNCNGIRYFRCLNNDIQLALREQFIYLTYRCSNCQNTVKTFSIGAELLKEGRPEGKCYKFGENPPFGPPIHAKLIKLLGPDRDEFIKGRRCENQGLGVGAFIYYRRVVENQKNRILGEILKVSEKLKSPQNKIDLLNNALSETQFTKALNIAKDALPESLLIDGHNPILLLHRILSEGIHNYTDEECLEYAGSVRIVLSELSDRLSQALKDEAELTKALLTLTNKKPSERKV